MSKIVVINLIRKFILVIFLISNKFYNFGKKNKIVFLNLFILYLLGNIDFLQK